MTAIADALIPPGTLDGALDRHRPGQRYDEECARSPWYAALLMRASLWLTWLAPLWLLGAARTFDGLDGVARVALLERLSGTRGYTVRMAAMFLKLVICTLMLGDEATLAQLGAYRLTPPAGCGCGGGVSGALVHAARAGVPIDEADFVIVGSGAGGGAAARILAASGARVSCSKRGRRARPELGVRPARRWRGCSAPGQAGGLRSRDHAHPAGARRRRHHLRQLGDRVAPAGRRAAQLA